MDVQDEKKTPVGEFGEVESWLVNIYADGKVALFRRGPHGRVIETYRPTTRERAALDLAAIAQGLQPLRFFPPAIDPIGPGGY